MTWTLILLMGINYGGSSVAIPMHDEASCDRAKNEWAERGNDTFSSPALKNSYCLNTETGEMK